MEALTDAYMAWCYRRDHGSTPKDLREEDLDMGMRSTYHIRVMDIYSTYLYFNSFNL